MQNKDKKKYEKLKFQTRLNANPMYYKDRREPEIIEKFKQLTKTKMTDGGLPSDRILFIEMVESLWNKVNHGHSLQNKSMNNFEMVEALQQSIREIVEVTRTMSDVQSEFLDMINNVDLTSARQSEGWNEDVYEKARSSTSVGLDHLVGGSFVSTDNEEDVEFPEG